MSLLKIALNEINLIKTQKISLVLVLLYPMLVVFSIGIAYSDIDIFAGTGFERVDVIYFIPEKSAKFDPQELIDKMSGFGEVVLHKAYSEEEVKQGIRKGTARVGLIVREPVTTTSRIEMDMYYDNSRVFASEALSFYVSSVVRYVALTKSVAILQDIMTDLESIQSKLETEMNKIDSFISKLESSGYKLEELRYKINSINLSQMQSELDTFDYYYYESKQEITNTKNDIYEAQAKLNNYRFKVENSRNELIYYKNEMASIRDQLTNLRISSPEPLYSQILSIEKQLNQKINDVQDIINELDQVLYDIDSTNAKLQEMDSKLSIAGQRLDQAKYSVENFRQTIFYLDSTITEVRTLLDEAVIQRQQILTDFKATRASMTNLVGTLKELSFYSPEYIANPIKIYSYRMYNVSNLGVITPMSISIVLLLTCMLLASVSILLERNQGVTLRAKLSPTPPFIWFGGKILGQLIFALTEAIIILVIALTIFRVTVAGSFLELFLVFIIASFSFISIGIFITNFTKTQSTAILASLLVMVPLLFLSGIVFPIDFMPSFMQGICNLLPLTVTNELITGVMVRGTSIFLLIPLIALLLIPSIILLIFSMFYQQRKG
ncbi:ABC transporter permease [Candidatus Micrarchaeota archaeon]|nr:ABC transporter permease [Candidatus Micrarchaeota archaeon]